MSERDIDHFIDYRRQAENVITRFERLGYSNVCVTTDDVQGIRPVRVVFLTQGSRDPVMPGVAYYSLGIEQERKMAAEALSVSLAEAQIDYSGPNATNSIPKEIADNTRKL